MSRYLFLLALAFIARADAAPTVCSDPGPSTITSAWVTIDAGPRIACTLTTLANGMKQPMCDMVGATPPGSHTLTVSWTDGTTTASSTLTEVVTQASCYHLPAPNQASIACYQTFTPSRTGLCP
jgi:hypothetical protein